MLFSNIYKVQTIAIRSRLFLNIFIYSYIKTNNSRFVYEDKKVNILKIETMIKFLFKITLS